MDEIEDAFFSLSEEVHNLIVRFKDVGELNGNTDDFLKLAFSEMANCSAIHVNLVEDLNEHVNEIGNLKHCINMDQSIKKNLVLLDKLYGELKNKSSSKEQYDSIQDELLALNKKMPYLIKFAQGIFDAASNTREEFELVRSQFQRIDARYQELSRKNFQDCPQDRVACELLLKSLREQLATLTKLLVSLHNKHFP